MMTSPITAGFAGMTHLGLCSAIAAASKGFSTLGFDPDAALIERLAAGRLTVVEPGLDDLLRRHRDRIAFTSDASRLAECQLVYVAPDVPTDDAGSSDLTRIDALLDVVVDSVSPEAVVVLLSQVPPGFTRARLRPDRKIFYQVETLIFGRAVERATQPERFIVGCANPAEPLPDALRLYLERFDCPILPMRLESAELTKISINCCLVASVTVANTLAELCEQIAADWSEIAPALRLDKRIGSHAYLAPGLGLAGGNLERDLATVMRSSEEYGTDAGLIRSFLHNSRYRRDWVLRTLHQALLSSASDPMIGVLGLAYKENTNSVKNSPALALIENLEPWRLRVFDPVISGAIISHPSAATAASALDAVDGVDALAIMTPWPEFRNLRCNDIAARMRGRLVLDPYQVLNRSSARNAGLDYRCLGVGPV